jgi:hypothetical protein
MYQPVGSVVFVVDPAVFERVSKFSEAGVPTVVKLTLPAPVSANAVLSTSRPRKLLDGSTNDRNIRRTDAVATLVRKLMSGFFIAMSYIGTSPEFRLR